MAGVSPAPQILGHVYWRARWLLAALPVAALLCGVSVNAANAENCRWRYEGLDSGKTSTGSMTVRSGESCQMTFWSPPPYRQEVTIVIPPSHGTAAAMGVDGFSYQSQAGYTGSDTFQVDVLFGHTAGYAKLIVAVTVQ
jgi:hypothetical protein